MVTYTGEDEEDDDDSDSDEEPATEMAVDDDTPWVEPPLVGSESDPYGDPSTSSRGAEIDRSAATPSPSLTSVCPCRVNEERCRACPESSLARSSELLENQRQIEAGRRCGGHLALTGLTRDCKNNGCYCLNNAVHPSTFHQRFSG